jgi:hypothetical protein
MANIEIFEPKAREVPPLRFDLLQGGKGSGPVNWLRNLEEGTVFLARQRNDKGPLLIEFFLENKKPDKACLLRQYSGQGVENFWVDSQRFSGIYELIEILKVFKPPQEEESNDERDRPDTS